MQKRVEPSSFARRALAITLSTSSIFSGSTFVSYFDDCGQYEQSSGHPPVFTLRSVQSWTSLSGWCSLCTLRASSRRGRSGRS